jgi:hypothetical protein
LVGPKVTLLTGKKYFEEKNEKENEEIDRIKNLST